MADNYLENKMAEYLSRKPKPTAHRSTAAPRPKPHTLSVNYPALNVMVVNGASGVGRQMVEAFRRIDAKVDFCDLPGSAGAVTAQQTGARFIPAICFADAEDIAFASRGNIDLLIVCPGELTVDSLSDESCCEIRVDTDNDADCKSAAAAALFMAQPANQHLSNTIVQIG